ncbi:MAG: hypothetical protein HOV78_30460 [Hamadaea sp.]|nr:hypothetical protein [Hamadaea sp.]
MRQAAQHLDPILSDRRAYAVRRRQAEGESASELVELGLETFVLGGELGSRLGELLANPPVDSLDAEQAYGDPGDDHRFGYDDRGCLRCQDVSCEAYADGGCPGQPYSRQEEGQPPHRGTWHGGVLLPGWG